MTILFKTGDMFNENVDAIVNTVNCVGVMGKGVALEFKKRWPENYAAYKKLCEQKKIQPGSMFVFDKSSLLSEDGPRYLVNFPTKNHWRAKSQLSFIEDGLNDLVAQIRFYQIKSIAIPPLGCGNGGLDWDVVKPLIINKLSALDDVQVIIFSPKEEAQSPEHIDTNQSRIMTEKRAILVKSFAEFEPYFGGYLTRLTTQKITYFLQVLGVNYGLQFSRNLFGPYSEQLRKALIGMDDLGYISGFTSDDRLITIPSASYAQAEEFLSKDNNQRVDHVIDKLSLLIQGFESPYGMELLATVHYLADKERCKPVEKVITEMASWSERKRTIFPESSIRTAYSRLVTDELIH